MTELFERAGKLIPAILETYQKSAQADGELAPALPKDSPPLWILMFSGLVWMQLALITLFGIGGYNVFRPVEETAHGHPSYQLMDTASQLASIFSQTSNFVIGAPAFVVTTSMLILSSICAIILYALSRIKSHALPVKLNFQSYLVRLFVMTCRFGICSWIGVLAIAGIQYWLNPTFYQTNERIFLGTFMAAVVGTVTWTYVAKRRLLTKRDQARRSIAILGFLGIVSAAFFSLMKAAELSIKVYPPTINIRVSQQCTTKNECILFLLAANTKAVVLDSEFRMSGPFFPANSKGEPDFSSSKREWRTIRFRVTPVDATQPLLILESGKEQIAYAKDVTYCAPEETKPLIPASAGSGNSNPHIVGSIGERDRLPVTIDLDRYYNGLLLQAEIAKCQ